MTTTSPWSAPVALDDVPQTGTHVDLVADEETRARIARMAGLRDLPQLEASFDLFRRGEDALSVVGEVRGIAGQNCVVTLDPIDNEIVEPVDLIFSARSHTLASDDDERKATLAFADADPPEPLADGAVDLGAVATEYFLLGIDPYPRKPGAVFEPPAQDQAADSPFTALAALRKRREGEEK